MIATCAIAVIAPATSRCRRSISPRRAAGSALSSIASVRRMIASAPSATERSIVEHDVALLVEREEGIVSDLPEMPVRIGEIARIPAPEYHFRRLDWCGTTRQRKFVYRIDAAFAG